MLTPTWILMILALVFLAADALGKLPSWTWGLCLLLILLLQR